MAELLGAVASGISIAQLAGQILATGLKLRRLFHEIRDAPESFEFLLGQIQIIAAALHELTMDDASEPGISSTLHGSLRAATDQCQKAADHLSSTIRDLTTELQTPRKFRRRLVAAKFVLKKDSIARFEHRLYTAVQCLTLTQQLYILAWQKIQPNIIISRIMQSRAFASGPCIESDLPSDTKHVVSIHSAETLLESPSSGVTTRVSHDESGSSKLQIGISCITGSLELEMLSAVSRVNQPSVRHSKSLDKEFPSSEATGLEVKFQMPPWLAYRVFEFFIQKSYVGWKGSLSMYRVHIIDDRRLHEALQLVRSDDDQALHQAFERRTFNPRDRYIDISGCERTLSHIALRFGAWKTCNYLLSLERVLVDTPCAWILWKRHAGDGEGLRQLQILLKQGDFSDHVRFQLFSNFNGDATSFDLTRKQIWPDDEFYHESFRNQRVQFAWFLTLSANPLAPTFFRHVLSPQGLLRAQDIYTGRLDMGYWDDTLLHILAIGVGSAGWHDKGTSMNWALVASDIIPLLCNHHELAPAERWDRFRTPLFASLFISLLPWPSSRIQNRKSMVPVRRHFRNMELGLKAWLGVLKDADVDLQAYGAAESDLFMAHGYGRHHYMYRVLEGSAICWDNYERLNLELIGFQYGRNVDDWALWWLEPTDVFAGDFWDMIEPGDQPVPGAWVDD